jgi:hypothetical protein
MTLFVGAVLIGLLIGLARGGHLANLRTLSFYWVPAGAIAAVVLAITRFGHQDSGGVVHVVALIVLMSTAVTNLQLRGAGLVGIGLAANIVPAALNGGTPVDPRALQVTGIDPTMLAEHSLLPTQHLASEHTIATTLGSALAIPGTGVIVSFGDLIIAVGLAVLVAHALEAKSSRGGIPVQEILAAGPLTIDLRTEPPTIETEPAVEAGRRRERSVEIGPGAPVPIPVGWAPPDDESTGTHPAGRLLHR